MIEEVRNEVCKLLDTDNSGHGMDHIDRVVKIANKIGKNEECDLELVTLIALLHDVDDHKLFGIENAKNLTNTKMILEKLNIDSDKKEKILDGVRCIGYSKRLQGLSPKSIEGKIVSDADMCDAMGAIGILRSYKYNIKINCPFFDRNNHPIKDMDANTYINKNTGTVVNHMFEKLLKLKDLMLTSEGKKEALKRHKFMVDFLRQYFDEEEAYDWIKYLKEYEY